MRTDQITPAWDSPWQRRGRLATVVATGCYSAVLLFATHYPKPERLVGGSLPSDKLLHFIAYGLLGVLVGATLVAHRRPAPRTFVRAFMATAFAAILDEMTQPIFGRAAEPLDWVFDCIGLTVGFGAVWLANAWFSSWAWARGSRPGSPSETTRSSSQGPHAAGPSAPSRDASSRA